MPNGSTDTHSPTTAQWTPLSRKPSSETRALARFLRNGTWTGTVKANGMGPGSPEMEARGHATCEWILNGLWLSCNFEQDQFSQGDKVLTWNAHWVVGWDMIAREYRAVGVDSNGVAFLFRGELEGDRLVMTLAGDAPLQLRFTWEVTESGEIAWKNESSMEGGPWTLIEEYVIAPQE